MREKTFILRAGLRDVKRVQFQLNCCFYWIIFLWKKIFLSAGSRSDKEARYSDKVRLHPLVTTDIILTGIPRWERAARRTVSQTDGLLSSVTDMIRKPFIGHHSWFVICFSIYCSYLFPASRFRPCKLNADKTLTFVSDYLCVAVHLVMFIALAAAPVLHFLHLSLRSVLRSVFRAEWENSPSHPTPELSLLSLRTFTND